MMICNDKPQHDVDVFEAHYDFDDAQMFDDA